MDLQIKATLDEERISKKTGTKYTCLILHLGGYDKIVLLSVPEIALLKQNIKG